MARVASRSCRRARRRRATRRGRRCARARCDRSPRARRSSTSPISTSLRWLAMATRVPLRRGAHARSTWPISHGSVRVAPSVEDLDALLARGVARPRPACCRRRATGRWRRRAPSVGAVLRDRAFPQREREQLAARDDGERCGRRGCTSKRPGARRRQRTCAPPACDARARAIGDACRVDSLAGIEQPEVGAALVRRSACRRSARGARRSRRDRCGGAGRCRRARHE